MEENQQFSQPAPQPAGKSETGRSKKFAVIFISLILIVGIGAAVMQMKKDDNKSTQATSEPTVEPQEVANVKITSAGFVPATIKVKVGVQVKWTNDDTAPHRIISGPHLKHDAVPDLDSEEQLEKGESFGYAFDKAGTYTYHDELNPSKLSGTVIVQ